MNETIKNVTKNVTPYAAAKIANAILRDESLPEIKPQMIYNYVRKNYISSIEIDGRKFIELSEFANWLSTYIEKKKRTIDSSNVDENVEEVRALLNM